MGGIDMNKHRKYMTKTKSLYRYKFKGTIKRDHGVDTDITIHEFRAGLDYMFVVKFDEWFKHDCDKLYMPRIKCAGKDSRKLKHWAVYNDNDVRLAYIKEHGLSSDTSYKEVQKLQASDRAKNRYHENRDTIIERSRKRYVDNREYIRAYVKQYYMENREARLVYYKNRRESNPNIMKKYRKENADKIREKTRQYRRTEHGKLNMLYNQMRHSSKLRGHPLPTFTKEEFIVWAYDNGFKKLHKVWVRSGYVTLLSPSPDRLDNGIGYSLDNLELVTWGVNKQRGYKYPKGIESID